MQVEARRFFVGAVFVFLSLSLAPASLAHQENRSQGTDPWQSVAEFRITYYLADFWAWVTTITERVFLPVGDQMTVPEASESSEALARPSDADEVSQESPENDNAHGVPDPWGLEGSGETNAHGYPDPWG